MKLNKIIQKTVEEPACAFLFVFALAAMSTLIFFMTLAAKVFTK